MQEYTIRDTTCYITNSGSICILTTKHTDILLAVLIDGAATLVAPSISWQLAYELIMEHESEGHHLIATDQVVWTLLHCAR